MKKVLGLVVSERRMGNSELLVKEIMGSVPEPCRREMIRLTEMRIEYCRACYRCLTPGTSCVKNDDFNFVMNKIMEVDGLVIGLPVYFLGPHGCFKMLLDRMLGAAHYAERTREKPCIVVMPFGMPGWEGYTRAAALVLPRMLEMKLAGFWQVHATLPGEGVTVPEYLEHARKLGRGMFTGGGFATGSRECPQCGGDLFRLLPDGWIECPLCSARGILKEGGVPEFSGGGHCRFSTEALREHFQVWLVEMKEKYLGERDRLKEAQKPYRGSNWWIRAQPGEDD